MAPEAKNAVESITVRVPFKSPASSSSTSPPAPSPCETTKNNCVSTELVLLYRAHFERSGLPDRVMYFNWDGSWQPFRDEVVGAVKSAFAERKPMIDLTIGGSKYIFDFVRMSQIDFGSGNQRSIAWIDVNGKCFFPKAFVGEDEDDDGIDADLEKEMEEETRKIQIEINIDGNSIKRKREGKREEPEVNSSSKEERKEKEKEKEQEEESTKRQRLVVTCRWPNARLMRETEREYMLVSDHFLPEMRKEDPSVVITGIYRCNFEDAQMGKARNEVFQKQIETTRAARGLANVVYAWHGTGPRGIASVLGYGFGMPSKVSWLDSYGVGVYLSPLGLPHLSAKLAEVDDKGEKHVVLCKVILGNVEKLQAGSQQCYPSSVEFDTGADDPKNPKWYVVWSSNMNRHVIPEFVVSFKSANYAPGQVKGSMSMRYSLEELFSKMRNSLPPTKIREVVTLYDAYRAGKMAREVFIRQLRCIVGDELLLSTIQEIRASE